MNKHLTHKRTLVTGGSRNVVPVIAKRLALEGSGVALAPNSKPGHVNETGAVAQSPGKDYRCPRWQPIDKRNRANGKGVGWLDILVNYADIAMMPSISSLA